MNNKQDILERLEQRQQGTLTSADAYLLHDAANEIQQLRMKIMAMEEGFEGSCELCNKVALRNNQLHDSLCESERTVARLEAQYTVLQNKYEVANERIISYQVSRKNHP